MNRFMANKNTCVKNLGMIRLSVDSSSTLNTIIAIIVILWSVYVTHLKIITLMTINLPTKKFLLI